MKLKDIIENIDKSEKNSTYISVERFADDAFGLNFYFHDEQERLKCYYFLNWYCTDTYVGGRAYFLDDELVATSWQSARKSSEEYYWLSKETYDNTKKYILSLMQEQKDTEPNLLDLNAEWGAGYKVDYSSQLLTDTVIFKFTLEKVHVIEKYHDMSKIDMWRKVKIRFNDNSEGIVDMDSVLVPYNLKY